MNKEATLPMTFHISSLLFSPSLTVSTQLISKLVRFVYNGKFSFHSRVLGWYLPLNSSYLEFMLFRPLKHTVEDFQ